MDLRNTIPSLHVEGTDDQHSIIHLLQRNGISFNPPPVDIRVENSDRELLEAIPVAIKAAKNRSIGFVIDIDTTPASRWEAIRARVNSIADEFNFRRLKSSFPASPSQNGTVISIPEISSKVGFWLMPDNRLDGGKLEDFLDTLIMPGDTLRFLAETTAGQSRLYGAVFAPQDQIKATLHTWLAWQKEPGRPCGTAIKANYFKSNSTAALKFVSWFRTLFVHPVG
jgi:hypothetical protein